MRRDGGTMAASARTMAKASATGRPRRRAAGGLGGPGAGVLAALWLTSGCGARAAESARLAEMTRTVDRLRSENAAYARQVEDLEAKVFLLAEDRASRGVRPVRVPEPSETPALPRVKLRAGAATSGADEAAAAEETGEAVEFAGEATRRTEKRPLLRIWGSGDPRPAATEPEPERDARVARVAVVDEAAPPRSDRRPAATRAAALQLYNLSLDRLRSGAHDEAVAGFRSFIERFPEHDYADNAQYWLGECFYDRKDFENAAREFRLVRQRFPEGNKVPDALLKAGFSLLALEDQAAARRLLEELVTAHPRHEAAALAAAKLAELPPGDGAARGPTAARGKEIR